MRKEFIMLIGLSIFAGSAMADIRIRAAGDTQLGTAMEIAPDGSLNAVQHLLRNADLTFINYEGTLCDTSQVNSHKCSDPNSAMCFAFKAPKYKAKELKEAGVDIVNLANNHILDFGHECVTQSREAILENQMLPIGAKPSTKSDIMETIAVERVYGKTIAFVGFHYSDAWDRVFPVKDLQLLRQTVRKMKKQYDLVVVSFHAGAEGPAFTAVPMGIELHKGENRGDVRAFAHAAVDEGADLLIGHGPHVIRGLEVYKNKLIIYSLGNFYDYTRFSFAHPMEVGAVVEIQITDQGDFKQGQVFSTLQKKIGKSYPNGQKGSQIYIDPDQNALNEFKRLTVKDFPGQLEFSNDGTFMRK